MIITQQRHTFTDTTTIGIVRAPGYTACSLEDCDRFLENGGQKIPGNTCIPRGKYELDITYSTRFKKMMIEVKNVPFFKGVRIHAGNTDADTDGCPLYGEYSNDKKIVNSAKKVDEIFSIVEEALKKEKVYLHVI